MCNYRRGKNSGMKYVGPHLLGATVQLLDDDM